MEITERLVRPIPRLKKIHWSRYECYLFIAPLFVGIFVFTLFPIIASLILSFTRWDMVTPPMFVGLGNYIKLFTTDKMFWLVLGNTFRFALYSIPPAVLIPLLLAVLLNRKIRGVTFFRAAFFLPLATSVVAIGLLFHSIYDNQFGFLNYLLGLVGIQGPNWLVDPTWAMAALAFATVWRGLGYNMIIYLSGLQGIPEPLYEAATIDGANGLDKFFRITIPLLTPQIFFILIMSVIGGFQSFGLIYIMTNGGPMNSTNVYIFYMWQMAIGSSKMGYASALGWILTMIIFAITLFQVRMARHWVHY
jgi:multiple sugar transport system permease protein